MNLVKPEQIRLDAGEFTIVKGKTFLKGEPLLCQRLVIDVDWQGRFVRITPTILVRGDQVRPLGEQP